MDLAPILVATALGVVLAVVVVRAARRRDEPHPTAERNSPPSGGGVRPLVTFGGDGSMTIRSGGAALRLGEAMPDSDAAEPRRDAVEVARDLVGVGLRASLEVLVDAVTVLVRRGARVPVASDRSSQQVVELVERLLPLSGASEVRAVIAAIADDPNRWLAVHALAGSALPELVIDEARRAGAPLGWQSVRALARLAPERLREPLASVSGVDLRLVYHGEAVIAAAGAGREDVTLLDAWHALEAEVASDERTLLEWRDTEVERLVHVDLERAIELWRLARDEWASPERSLVPLIHALASRDPDRARTWLAEAMDESPEPYDWLPIAEGCAQAGLDVADVLTTAADRIHARAYRPAAVFGTLLRVHLQRGDLDALERLLRRAGPHRWQTSLYAAHVVRQLATAASPALEPALELLLARYEPGPVAARDASAGLAVGHVMMRPAEYALSEVHPCELVVLRAAMTEPTPEWVVTP
jgi:hypothetical protein